MIFNAIVGTDFLVNALLILISVVGALLTFYLREYIKRMQNSPLDDMMSDIEKDLEVYQKLEETLYKVKCDRIALFQLHNGDSFLGTNNSFRKVSNTYEIPAAGISSEQKSLFSMPITVFSPQLNYMQENGFLYVENVEKKNSAVFNTGLLKMRGVKTVYKIPVFSLSNKIMAYISAEWVRDTIEFDSQVLKDLQETAAIISGYLYKFSKKRK